MRDLGICDIYLRLWICYYHLNVFFSLWYVIQISLQNGLYLMGRAFLVQTSSVPHPQGRNAEGFQKTDLTRSPIQSDNTWILWILSRFNKIVHGSSMPINEVIKTDAQLQASCVSRSLDPFRSLEDIPQGHKNSGPLSLCLTFCSQQSKHFSEFCELLMYLIVCSEFGALSEAHPGLATGIWESRNLGTQPCPEGLTVSGYTLKCVA